MSVEDYFAVIVARKIFLAFLIRRLRRRLSLNPSANEPHALNSNTGAEIHLR
ncbi:hypothetical protein L484_010112 [Morus notabilis]|uniref:Uncharacterized protein n=1 Tax=Morus notabilis TaxID=981085 RepID=W9QJ35_9ROSA|nr:hypothetical protein L484_010112 [Morus notabilis]